MGYFYFVRHGQTVWNVENKICGVTDSPLTQLGHEQACKLGETILSRNLQIDRILYSPLSRAADTAKHISEVIHVPAYQEERLLEQNFGKWEGTARDGLAFQQAKCGFADHFGNGESMLQLCQRIYNLLDELKASSQISLLVAHNGIARAVESYFHTMSNEEYARFGIENCEIRRYDF